MKKYFKIVSTIFQNRFEYRNELITSVISGLLVFAGQAVFWSAVFANRDLVGLYSFNQLIFYYVFVRIISDIADSNIGFIFSRLILDGTISNHLLKPVRIEIWFMAKEFGRIIVRLLIKIFIYLLFFFVLFGKVDLQMSNIFLFFISCVFSFLISYFVFYSAGCLAFWSDNARSLNYALRRVVLFLAGGLVPISYFPEVIREILNFTPFRYIISFPMRVLMGWVNTKEIFTSFLIQIVWILILWQLSSKMFKFSVRKNESVGI